mmetsp:Transcript_37239/g.52595  ORF Transcript_37239/g.52595 Transcript_37239/m.52595 type:complete len:143 (-) Transcript_37239:969-1397(-)
MFEKVEHLAQHNRPRTENTGSSPRLEEIEYFHGHKDNVDSEYLGNPRERHTVAQYPHTFLDDSDSSVNCRHMLVSTGQINPGSARYRLPNLLFERPKFVVRMNCVDGEPTMQIILIDFKEGLEYLLNFPVCQVIGLLVIDSE